jgi:hypothetical protein
MAKQKLARGGAEEAGGNDGFGGGVLMRSFLLGICLVALAATAAPALACKRIDSPNQKLENGYNGNAIVAVALVKISDGRYTHPKAEDGDNHPWEVTATVQRMLKGEYEPKSVKFERGWGSAACDDGRPLPGVGEQWVVYFEKKLDGTLAVWQTYPVSVANRDDPQLKGQISKFLEPVKSTASDSDCSDEDGHGPDPGTRECLSAVKAVKAGDAEEKGYAFSKVIIIVTGVLAAFLLFRRFAARKNSQ